MPKFVDFQAPSPQFQILVFGSLMRGRMGFAADKVLVYSMGGPAYVGISHAYTNLLTGVAETTSAFRTRWTAGAGVEVAWTANLLVRAEYRYTDYGPYRYDSVTAFPGFAGQKELVSVPCAWVSRTNSSEPKFTDTRCCQAVVSGIRRLSMVNLPLTSAW